jgi:hypothetical protein
MFFNKKICIFKTENISMKTKLILYVLLFLGFVNLSYSVCCNDVYVTAEYTSDCCIKINVTNPSCWPIYALFVFDQWDSSTSSWVRHDLCSASQYGTFYCIMCPYNDETYVQYRVRIYDKDVEDVAYCGGLLSNWIEGTNQYSGTLDLTQCCQCPANKSSWLKTTIFKSRSCPDNGCLVTLAQLNLPPEDVCYTKYQIKWGNEPLTPMKHLATDPIWYNSKCVPQGEHLIINLYLYKEGDSDPATACRILRIMGCTEDVPSVDSTGVTCTPDCYNSPWEIPRWRNIDIPKGSGCFVSVLYTYRTACPPTNYQDLQVMQISDNNGCIGSLGMTDRELYQQAVKRLVEIDPMGFEPHVGNTGCDSLWRIIKTECWRNIYYMTVPDWTHPYGQIKFTMQQCDSSECCMQQYTVCRDTANNITMTPMGMSIFPVSPSCPYIPVENIPYIDEFGNIQWGLTNMANSEACHTTCDWVNIIPGQFIVLPAKAAVEQKDLSYKSNDESNDKITINCSSEQTCSLRIEYYDLLGKLAYTYKRILQNTVNDLDISSLIAQKGMFIYRVYVNDVIVKNGKLIK